jgi:tetratricopeptide (TPR) repeat protein
MPRRRSLRNPRLWLTAAVFLLGVFATGLSASNDSDIWWHLAAGREMVRLHALLRSDPFSISAAGRPWPDVHWLFQLLVYAVYGLGGLAALVVAKSVALAAGARWLLASVLSRSGKALLLPFAITFLAALFAARELLLVRPVIVTLVLLAYFFYALERTRTEPRLALLVPLPFLQILWSNVQGLFVLGPALVTSYAIASLLATRFGTRRWFPFAPEARPLTDARRQARSLSIAAVACCLAALVTPFGSGVIRLPLALFMRLVPASQNVFSANVAENVPPLSLSESDAGQFGHLPWFLLFLFAALVVPWRKLLLSHLAVVGALVTLALMANRNVLLLYWLATPIALANSSPLLRWLAARSKPKLGAASSWLAYASLGALLLLVGSAAAKEPSLREPTPFRVPEASARLIARAHDRAPIFAADHYGGYLIWALYPEHKPYLDTRLILRTAEQYREFLDVVSQPERFAAFAARHDFGYVTLPTAYPDRYLPLLAHLAASPEWKLVYTDGSETLFARQSSELPAWDLAARETTDRVLAGIEGRFSATPALRSAARLQLGTLELALGAFAEADHVLATTGTREAETLRGRARLLRGDYAGARDISERLLLSEPDDVQNLNLRATAALALGDPEAAKAALSQAFQINPSDNEAENILRRMEDARHVQHP